ncbi:hypothetical protein CYY_003939 [Polysphondylium violaceum]|uniref:G-protein coupled receptors family 3 profile domain-containing protein n=1 Tax=Polysphondylium violaceum TaxID=133409 RepID=A0A8J4PW70_9MYCE|nr:hypothetical protein CYY_003939 [Polysphondylium violaceum]
MIFSLLLILGGVLSLEELRLGFMAPQGDPEYTQYEGAALIAIQELQPQFTQLNYEIKMVNVSSDLDAVIAAIEMKDLNVSGVVGPAYTGDSSVSCLIFGSYKVPSVSFYATGTELSDSGKYPYFNRVMPDDLLQVRAILALAKHLGWERISCVHTNEDYGIGGANILVREANNNAVTVNTIQSVDPIDGDVVPSDEAYDRVFNNLEAAKARVIVAYAIFPNDCTNLWTHAKRRGFLGEGFTWIVTDGCAELTNGNNEDFKGVLAVFPNYGLGGEKLKALENQIVNSNVYNADGNSYFKGASFSYDATYSLLLSFLKVINGGLNIWDTKNILDTLRSNEFEGVTGKVGFDAETGDRLYGVFSLLNLINITKGSFDKIGEINPQTWEVNISTPITFLGDTHHVPSDYEVVEYSIVLNAVLGAITGVCVLFVLFICVVIVSQWRKFRYSSPLFCILIILGALLGYASIFVLLPSPTQNLCSSFPWLLGIGYVIMFGTLFTKTWRTWRLFANARKFKIIRISNKMMFTVVGSFVLLESVFMILWTTVDRPEVLAEPIYKSGQAQLQCSSDSMAWWFVFVFYKVFYVVIGVFLAFKTRDVVDSLNESKPITLSLYNLTFVMLIAIPLGFILRDYPTAVMVIEVVAILLSFTATVGLLFLPKVWKIVSGQQHSMDSHGSSDSMGRNSSARSYNGTTTDMKMESMGRKSGQAVSVSVSNTQQQQQTQQSQEPTYVSTNDPTLGIVYNGGESLPTSSIVRQQKSQNPLNV